MTLNFDLKQLEEITEEVFQKFKKKDYSPAMKKARDRIVEKVTSCFENQRDPAGEKWQTYTDDTIKFKERNNITINAPLLQTLELYDALADTGRGVWNITNYSLSWRPKLGGDVQWKIKTHNFGKKNNKMFRNPAPITPRRFMLNKLEFEEVVEETFKEVLKELAK